MTLCENSILQLRERIKPYMSERRHRHTLGVEKAAARIGCLIMSDKVAELRVAALLHDIAKERTVDEQLEFIHSCGISLTDEDANTKSALHAFAAPGLIKRDFSEYASDEILKATFTHTLGSPDMSIFAEIIFLADFVEDSREYESCRKTAEYLFSSLSNEVDHEHNLRVLHTASIMAINYTELSLSARGEKINSTSVSARKMLENLI